MVVKSYEELVVWQKAMLLVEEVYRAVKKLPKEELYALSDQMRRAVVSIPSNIAEGHMRAGTKEFINFLSIANGSRAEVETQLKICQRLNYLTDGDVNESLNLCIEVGKMINVMISKLSAKLGGRR